MVSKAAAQNNPNAQFGIGLMYTKGQGVRQDYTKAMEWYLKAAAQNNPFAQIGIGMLYDNGWGIRQNRNTAKEWYGEACDNGNQFGCDMYRELNK